MITIADIKNLLKEGPRRIIYPDFRDFMMFGKKRIATINLLFFDKVLMHVVNHMGHYPLCAGPSRVDSSISEHEDNPNVDADDLSSSIFSAPNVQVGSIPVVTVLPWLNMPLR